LDLFLEGQEGYNRYLPQVPITPGLLSTVQTTFNHYDVRLFIIDRSVKGSGTVTRLITMVAGAPTVADGDFILWSSNHGPL
jgi:hypothetical protein